MLKAFDSFAYWYVRHPFYGRVFFAIPFGIVMTAIQAELFARTYLHFFPLH